MSNTQNFLWLSSSHLLWHKSQMIFLKCTQFSIHPRGLISTGSVSRKYKPNAGTFHCLKPLIWRLLIKNFVAKWSWMRRFSDWLGFFSVAWQPKWASTFTQSHFEESVIKWLPLSLLSCMTPCHLQGSTRRRRLCFYWCMCVWACFFGSVLEKN